MSMILLESTHVVDEAPVEEEPQLAGVNLTVLAKSGVLVPEVAFRKGNIDLIVKSVETEARAQAAKLDISSDRGREAIASLAYKVARSKTALDDAGKELNEEAQAKIAAINADRKVARDRLDALKEEVRDPLSKWEEANKARVAGHKVALAEIEAMAVVTGLSAEDINARIWSVPALEDRAWGEFEVPAERMITQTLEGLRAAHEVAVAAEAVAAEKARVKAAEKARLDAEAEAKRIERERQIAEDARVAAEVAAEAKAEAARLAAARALAVANERAEQAERDRVAADQKAVWDAEQAALKAEADKQAAIRAERDRIAEARALQKAADDKRAANAQHRTEVEQAAIADLVKLSLTTEQATAVVAALGAGDISHCGILY